MSCEPLLQCHAQGAFLTCYDLWALEVFVGVEIARRQGKVDAHADEQEVDSPPHVACSRGALVGV